MVMRSGKVSRLEYLGRSLDAVDLVQNGRGGSISESKWLRWNYSPEFVDILSQYIRHPSPSVRAEAIILLTLVKDSSLMAEIENIRKHDVDIVTDACVAYLNGVYERNRIAEEYMELLRYGYGDDFREAAEKLVPLASIEHIDELRKIMGEVDEKRRELLRRILNAIVDRNPSLEELREGILSRPLQAEADSYNKFLDRSFEYINLRYRRTVHPRETVDDRTRDNILNSLKKMRTRQYRERTNLHLYPEELHFEHTTLSELIKWCSDDLDSKGRETYKAPTLDCPACGSPMLHHLLEWYCPICNLRREL